VALPTFQVARDVASLLEARMGPLLAHQSAHGCWWLPADQGWPLQEVAPTFKVSGEGAHTIITVAS
jgi:hypothetical protein